MDIGTDRISPQQANMLARARESLDARVVAEFLRHVLNDNDVRRGSEQIHPGWEQLYREHQDIVDERFRGMPHGERLQAFMAKMSPYDVAVSRLDPANSAVTFLLGAGASKPSPSNIPTVMELLPDLLARARRLDRDDLTALADFCEERKLTNIEDLPNCCSTRDLLQPQLGRASACRILAISDSGGRGTTVSTAAP